jgi:hypothetical protein
LTTVASVTFTVIITAVTPLAGVSAILTFWSVVASEGFSACIIVDCYVIFGANGRFSRIEVCFTSVTYYVIFGAVSLSKNVCVSYCITAFDHAAVATVTTVATVAASTSVTTSTAVTWVAAVASVASVTTATAVTAVATHLGCVWAVNVATSVAAVATFTAVASVLGATTSRHVYAPAAWTSIVAATTAVATTTTASTAWHIATSVSSREGSISNLCLVVCNNSYGVIFVRIGWKREKREGHSRKHHHCNCLL